MPLACWGGGPSGKEKGVTLESISCLDNLKDHNSGGLPLWTETIRLVCSYLRVNFAGDSCNGGWSIIGPLHHICLLSGIAGKVYSGSDCFKRYLMICL